MKISQKILSLIIAMCLLPFSVSADTGASASGSASVVFDKLISLELLDASDTVSGDYMLRSDFVRLAMKTAKLPPESVAVKDAFSDLESGGINRTYINSAYSLGYLTNQNGRFYPNKPISLNDTVKLVMGIMGYNTLAESSGGYPTGYIKYAHSSGLLNGITPTDSNALTVDEAMAILNNALDSKIVEITYADSDTRLNISKRTLAEHLGIFTAEGIVTENGITGLYYAQNSSRDEICINGIYYKSGTSQEYSAYLGMNCRVYYTEGNSSGIPTAKYLEPVEASNKTVRYSGEDIAYDNGSYIAYDDDKNRTLKLDSNASFIYNGQFAPAGSFDYTTDNGYITLIDNNTDGRYDVILIMDFRIVMLTDINITDSVIITNTFEELNLEPDDDTVIDIRLDNNPTELGNIVPPLAASYAESSGSDMKVKTLLISSNVVRGKVTGKDEESVYIDGVKYDAAQELDDTVSVGAEGVFYADSFGTVVYFTASSTGSYGYIKAIRQATGVDKTWQIRMFKSNGSFDVFRLDDSVRFNGSKMTDLECVNSLKESGDGTQLIRYSANADGLIKEIETAVEIVPFTDEADYAAENDIFRFSFSGNHKFRRRSTLMSFDGLFSISSSTKIFVIPENAGSADDDGFLTISSSTLGHDISYEYEAYNVDKYGNAGILVLRRDGWQRTLSDLYIAKGVSRIMDSNGDTYTAIKAYTNGSLVTYPLSDESLLNGKSFSEGDIFECTVDSNQRVKTITMLYQAESGEKPSFANASVYTSSTAMCGTVRAYDRANGVIVLDRDGEFSVLTLGTLKNASLYQYGKMSTVSTADITVGDILCGEFNYLTAEMLIIIR